MDVFDSIVNLFEKKGSQANDSEAERSYAINFL